jgi:hypothetical protein
MTRIIKIEGESAKLPVRIWLKGKWLERADSDPAPTPKSKSNSAA